MMVGKMQQQKPTSLVTRRVLYQIGIIIIMMLLIMQLSSSVVHAEDCASDNDCKPAVCCGGTACVPVEQAPSTCDSGQCGCEPFTLDCGGKCVCSATKRCAAILNQNTGGAGSSPVVDGGGGGGGGDGGRRRRRKPG